MQIRVIGLPAEASAAVIALRASERLNVLQVSGPYPCRGESVQIRVYVTALLRDQPPEVTR